ncbi:MAG: hypothetical protein QOE54_3050 [Streptosporangiaceae bacterium]|jgi:hypothetical protein|nr:hypothetical protein [Streptosporangiaceae bacterium]MDX6430684.1 hypothetical protein [Streptosporangiaceae bacterium]
MDALAGLGRQVRIAVVTVVASAVLGVLAGLLWAAISPHVKYVSVDGKIFLIDPESPAVIGTDGRFALITAGIGLACGVAAYLAAGRGNDLVLVAGLAVGGIVAALLAWRVGHLIGLDTFHRMVRAGDRTRAFNGPADLAARGVLVCWPFVALVAYGLLEAIDVANRIRPDGSVPAGDLSGPRTGQHDQVGGGQFDLQAAPTGRDVDGRQA